MDNDDDCRADASPAGCFGGLARAPAGEALHRKLPDGVDGSDDRNQHGQPNQDHDNSEHHRVTMPQRQATGPPREPARARVSWKEAAAVPGEKPCRFCGLEVRSFLATCTECDESFCGAKGLLDKTHVAAHNHHWHHHVFLLSCGRRIEYACDWCGTEGTSPTDSVLPEPPAEFQQGLHQLTQPEVKKLTKSKLRLPRKSHCDRRPNQNLPPNQSTELKVVCEEEEQHTPGREFATPDAYAQCFTRLLEWNREAEEARVAAQAQDVYNVIWFYDEENQPCARFKLPLYDELGMRLAIGDQLELYGKIVDGCLSRRDKGIVTKAPVDATDYVVIHLEHGYTPGESEKHWRCVVLFDDSTYKRTTAALQQFRDSDSLNPEIQALILGNTTTTQVTELPHDFSTTASTSLNDSQLQAIQLAATHRLSLIQGPPGTGKTTTSAQLVQKLRRLFGQMVLVCAPSNTAVDTLAARIAATGLTVIRFVSKRRDPDTDPLRHLRYEEKIKHHRSRNINMARFHELRTQKEISGLDPAQWKEFSRMERQVHSEIFAVTDVVCATCVGAVSPVIRDLHCKILLIDEATQGTEPELLIPMMRGIERLILVGDHRQLGPVVLSQRAAAGGLATSLFERLLQLGHPSTMLNVQYRMHAALAAFPSTAFYGGKLLNGVTEAQRTSPSWTWPAGPQMPCAFLHHVHPEVKGEHGSAANPGEAELVAGLVKMLLLQHRASDIGIITSYDAQRRLLRKNLELDRAFDGVELQNVDAFQGKEKEFILISTVRSNALGFLNDARRLNVAITRAKRGLIIFGNGHLLSTDPLWAELLKYYERSGVIVDAQRHSP
ncbi:unnamed protein product, partial [Mesorhabditis spiculigera]